MTRSSPKEPLVTHLEMKRKLDQDDMPAEASRQALPNSAPRFEDLQLDARLLRAITKEAFTKPTQVQADAIPLALAGKDILGWAPWLQGLKSALTFA